MSAPRWATFNRLELSMTTEQAESASHPGPCDSDVDALLRDTGIAAQLDTITPEPIRDELRGYGAWDEAELADDAQNRARIVWIAAGDIAEGRDLVDCGCCGARHPNGFEGDCRDDENRF